MLNHLFQIVVTLRKHQRVSGFNDFWNEYIPYDYTSAKTFFDAERTGTEYEDFIKNPDWNRDAYQNRLDRLCSAISTLNADVFVLQEVENSNVILDISNKLQTNAWNSKQQWVYSCFAKKEGTSIGIAILSKYPLENLKTHSLQIQNQ